MFFDATRDSKTGTIYVKVVNRAGTLQPVHVALSGAGTIEAGGQVIAMCKQPGRHEFDYGACQDSACQYEGGRIERQLHADIPSLFH
jgi:hypothetical protein